jgi:S-adenosyl-L-methionine hydrolase (adenosine-forming)
LAAILTLTTDFGLSDHYVGTMKGVILGICPQARLVDISHQVPPFAITEGAYLLSQTYRYFPKGTVHLVVVDPGVGSKRRPIVAEAAGQFFVAPDNGVLSAIYVREKHAVRLLENEEYFHHPVSRTFHGRDIFSPVAAHLAAGVSAKRLGKIIRDYVQSGFARPRRAAKDRWDGHILHIDSFGNIVTNFHSDEIPHLTERPLTVQVGRRMVRRRARNYAERPAGELFAIVGSGGYLEVSVNQGSAAKVLGCESGAAVGLRLL